MTGSAARAVPLRSSQAPPLTRTESWTGSASRRVLRLVPQRRARAATTPFAVVLVAVLGGGLLGLLVLNTLVAQGSFALHDLAKQARVLQQREQLLSNQVQALQAPAQLAGRATALGMVPGGPPAFLRLPDGRVLGQPTPGQPLTPATPAPTPAVAPGPAGGRRAAPAVPPSGSTTWTAPRPTAPPSTGAHR